MELLDPPPGNRARKIDGISYSHKNSRPEPRPRKMTRRVRQKARKTSCRAGRTRRNARGQPFVSTLHRTKRSRTVFGRTPDRAGQAGVPGFSVPTVTNLHEHQLGRTKLIKRLVRSCPSSPNARREGSDRSNDFPLRCHTGGAFFWPHGVGSEGKIQDFPIMKKTKLTQPPRAPGTRPTHHRLLHPMDARVAPTPAPGSAPPPPAQQPSPLRGLSRPLLLSWHG